MEVDRDQITAGHHTVAEPSWPGPLRRAGSNLVQDLPGALSAETGYPAGTNKLANKLARQQYYVVFPSYVKRGEKEANYHAS